MFVNAIEKVMSFTRPIQFISRNYLSSEVRAGAATLIILNKDGWALTCRHVAKTFIDCENINDKYKAYQKEYASLKGTRKDKNILQSLGKKYSYDKKQTVQIKVRFAGCVDKMTKSTITLCGNADLALIKFHGFNQLGCNSFPVFPKDMSQLKQGKYICRVGFPFPEFNDFAYDQAKDEIDWITTGRSTTPQFPIEGMLTRNVLDNNGKVVAFEMSTPGLRGQSGGPAFDMEGRVWGIQSETVHLDLDFDVDQEVFRSGIKKHVHDSAFLHVGRCVHVNIIKDFLKANSVEYDEA